MNFVLPDGPDGKSVCKPHRTHVFVLIPLRKHPHIFTAAVAKTQHRSKHPTDQE
jgi:hypothetical protein